jgi:hypothetical protein
VSFHTLAIVTCISALLLATGWLFAGRLMLKRWHVEPSVAALLVGRRIGAVHLGVGPAILINLVQADH